MPAMTLSHTADEPFDVRQLRLLVLLATEPSLSAAARKLHLTQSAISHTLKKLEEDVGARLVDRNERGAELTQAGQALARRATHIFREMRAAREELYRLQHWGSQHIRIGASATACQYFLPPVIGAFREKYPKCHVEVSSGNSQRRLEDLRADKIDLAIVTHTGLEEPDLQVIDLCHETLVLISLTPPEAAGVGSFIGYQRGSSLSHDALLWFDGESLARPQPVMELESLEAIKSLVKLGLGCAILPSWAVRDELADHQLYSHPPSGRPIMRTWSIVMKRGHQPTLGEADWVRLCQTHGPIIIESRA
jgi:LysR family transcriptional regulator, low CO2-responsive transcriptional regulator